MSGLSFPSASGALESGTTYAVERGGSTSFDFRVQGSSQTNIIGVSIPSGTFTYQGVLGQFNGGSGNDERYQLLRVQDSDNPLLVGLTEPTAQFDNDAVMLRWRTASETINAGFGVQHKEQNADRYTETG